MRAAEANSHGSEVAAMVRAGQIDRAYDHLAPILAARTPFAALGRIGVAVGQEPLDAVNEFLDVVASHSTEGGWVIIGTALGAQLGRDQRGALRRCRRYVVVADVWYGADILGERVPGPALVSNFEPSLRQLAPWRDDANRWVRRAVGVSVHFWAKRSRGAPELCEQAEAVLAFVEPMFEEWEVDAVKGVGWGLKTLGRHYPELLSDWLVEQVAVRSRRHRALLLRKALTYLPASVRAKVTASGG